jgi:hypothetical protein
MKNIFNNINILGGSIGIADVYFSPDIFLFRINYRLCIKNYAFVLDTVQNRCE